MVSSLARRTEKMEGKVLIFFSPPHNIKLVYFKRIIITATTNIYWTTGQVEH